MASELKSRIERCYTALNISFSEHNAKILNKASAELYSLTGEIMISGDFVFAKK